MRTRLLCWAATMCVALDAGVAVAADAPVPGTSLPDLVGPRTLALSAGVGLPTGNDGIFLNPGALAARRRYSVETLGFLDRRGPDTSGELLGGSVVDSISAPITAAFAYTRAQEGPYHGNVWSVAFAGAIADRFYVGASGKFLGLTGVEGVQAATVDAGIFWQAADYLAIGAAGYNLVPIGHEQVAPMGVGAGLTIGSDEFFQVTGDWRADLDRNQQGTKNRYGVGAEMLLGHLVPVRAGYQIDEVLDTKWWSVGAGVVSRSGIALDVGYRQSTTDPSARTIVASLRMFLFN